MRALPSPPLPASASASQRRADWGALRRLLPYLWRYRWRVGLALALMVAAKMANVGVPVLLKHLVDAMSVPTDSLQALWVVPAGLIVAYGLLRLSTTLFTELRELVFAKATEGATRHIALQVFEHLHQLSLRFHLERQTGGMTRDIERGTRGVQSLISYSLYSVLPTLIEVGMVLVVLGTQFDAGYVWVTLLALACYVVFTVVVTEWRTKYRRELNLLDSEAHTRAVDSLLNYETVKYFNNEAFESRRYDERLHALRRARIKSHNAFMIQLYIPLNFLGVLYREIKQSLTDLDRMFALLDKHREVADAPNAPPLALSAQPSISFESVGFAYDPKRPILRGVSFRIEAGQTVAVVGASGAGKSTLGRLLYRFYDVQQGRVLIDGQDLRSVQQDTLRQAIGIVPQDTVLFNDTIEYNIRYGAPGASHEAMVDAAQRAHVHDFIVGLPQGYQTMVGERGLKLSGGEKQRVAIARTLLKNPPVLIFDEATSALDSANERAIQAELRALAAGKTTLVIAHRLSTVVDADMILVLADGAVIERGRHPELLAQQGAYARMWALQQSRSQASSSPSTQS
ncbi:MAG: ABC transporter ATP-binding protein/permease [Betaproteobacteria bacterium]|nr:ABC transporter ATP-binding protein/permease [Candidatus Fonsibacter lacus]